MNFDTSNDTEGQAVLDRVDVLGSGGIPVEVVPLAQGRATLQNTLAVTGQHVALSPAGHVIAVTDGGRPLRLCRIPSRRLAAVDPEGRRARRVGAFAR